MIVNVSSTHTATASSQLSRHDLLAWVNSNLKSKFNKVDELCTGAAYCQMMHALYPREVPIKRVKFYTNLEHEFIENFKILQNVFQKLDVKKAIPIDRLVRGKFQDNIEFLQWFKKFYDANYEANDYDPISARNGLPMGYGSMILKKKSKLMSPRRNVHNNNMTRIENSIRNSDESGSHVLKRSLTRTELRHDLTYDTALKPYNPPDISATPISKLPVKLHQHAQNRSAQLQRIQNKTQLQLNQLEMGFERLAAEMKIEKILAYCEDAKIAGKKVVEINEIMNIINAKTDKAENEMDPLCAGDHVELKDVVAEVV